MAEMIAGQMQMPKDAPPPRAQPGQLTPQGTLPVFEPATGKLLGEVRVATRQHVSEVVAQSHAAQAEWARRSFRERAEVLLRFKDALLANADALTDHIARENGKTKNEALFQEVLPVADLTSFFARRAQRILRDERLPLHLFPHKKSTVHYAPRGVIGVISPWNFPMSIPAGDVVMALAAGNGCVLKPSEFTPLIAEKLQQMLVDAGLPHGLFAVVHGKGDVGAALIASGIQQIVFTGSVPTGKRVAMAAAEQLIPCVLELGGKDPALVLRDADLDLAARRTVWGAFANSGQVCASIERVYVDESVAAAFTEKVVALASKLRQGDPVSLDTDVGAMTTPGQVEIVRRHLEDAKAKGARVLAGGQITLTEGGGRFVQPTVLGDATQDMAVVREETFGPMLPILTFKSEEEAVRLANDSQYGLSAYVFTRDRVRARKIAAQLEAGTVIHNDALYTHAAPETPWGGVKASGLGRVHSAHGLRDLCEMRHVNIERFSVPTFWMYPYGEKAYRLGLRLYRTLLAPGVVGKARALFGK
jgi:succinate-semialdehyde dehydrogenase/glutarate-semialdehyde dehydrogenase